MNIDKNNTYKFAIYSAINDEMTNLIYTLIFDINNADFKYNFITLINGMEGQNIFNNRDCIQYITDFKAVDIICYDIILARLFSKSEIDYRYLVASLSGKIEIMSKAKLIKKIQSNEILNASVDKAYTGQVVGLKSEYKGIRTIDNIINIIETDKLSNIPYGIINPMPVSSDAEEIYLGLKTKHKEKIESDKERGLRKQREKEEKLKELEKQQLDSKLNIIHEMISDLTMVLNEEGNKLQLYQDPRFLLYKYDIEKIEVNPIDKDNDSWSDNIANSGTYTVPVQLVYGEDDKLKMINMVTLNMNTFEVKSNYIPIEKMPKLIKAGELANMEVSEYLLDRLPQITLSSDGTLSNKSITSKQFNRKSVICRIFDNYGNEEFLVSTPFGDTHIYDEERLIKEDNTFGLTNVYYDFESKLIKQFIEASINNGFGLPTIDKTSDTNKKLTIKKDSLAQKERFKRMWKAINRPGFLRQDTY